MTSLDDRILDDLREWRDEQVAKGNLEQGAVTDSRLNQILRSGKTSADDIAQILPASAKWAAQFLAVLINRDRIDAPLDPPEPETPIDTAVAAEPTLPAPDADFDETPDPLPDIEYTLSDGDFPNNDVIRGTGSAARLSITSAVDGYRLDWKSEVTDDPGVVIYRVAARDDYEPHRPDRGRFIAATTSAEAYDTAPLVAAARFVVVWRHRGSTIDEAKRSAPELLARGQIIAPVSGFEVVADHGSVIGRWSVLPNTTRVRVYRVPLRGMIDIGDERHRILATNHNLTGFTDTEVSPGRYLYRAISEVDIGDGTVLSVAAEDEVDRLGDLQRITDLTVQQRGAGTKTWLDLSWTTPPSGDVHIYRTAAKPPLSLSESVVVVERLTSTTIAADAQLTAASRVPNPIVPGEMSQMTEVAWPSDWVFVYLTPVTTHDGKVQVGTTMVAARRAEFMPSARVVERCNEQIITMAWPAEADEIRVYVAGNHIPVETAVAQRPVGTIDRDMYVRDGGLHLPEPLPALGCSVHLVPVTFAAGAPTLGVVTSIEYPGLLRVRYEVLTIQLKRRDRWLQIRLLPELDRPSAPPFVLVHNPERLPLSIDDGRRIDTYFYDQNAGSASVDCIIPAALRRGDPHLVWRVPADELAGYVRLFADVRPEQQQVLAIIDPPLRTLRLTGPSRGR
ncbi:hypothetical protein ACQPW1_24535 [Nocardia sp. CA-128927]|uniref:hypothetical protein n=1 Tax=Nocardia sp. CA-128927 TaxID=3239975 RepID=UPI003D99E72F